MYSLHALKNCLLMFSFQNISCAALGFFLELLNCCTYSIHVVLTWLWKCNPLFFVWILCVSGCCVLIKWTCSLGVGTVEVEKVTLISSFHPFTITLVRSTFLFNVPLKSVMELYKTVFPPRALLQSSSAIIWHTVCFLSKDLHLTKWIIYQIMQIVLALRK